MQLQTSLRKFGTQWLLRVGSFCHWQGGVQVHLDNSSQDSALGVEYSSWEHHPRIVMVGEEGQPVRPSRYTRAKGQSVKICTYTGRICIVRKRNNLQPCKFTTTYITIGSLKANKKQRRYDNNKRHTLAVIRVLLIRSASIPVNWFLRSLKPSCICCCICCICCCICCICCCVRCTCCWKGARAAAIAWSTPGATEPSCCGGIGAFMFVTYWLQHPWIPAWHPTVVVLTSRAVLWFTLVYCAGRTGGKVCFYCHGNCNGDYIQHDNTPGRTHSTKLYNSY